jgi:hypothetical protein
VTSSIVVSRRTPNSSACHLRSQAKWKSEEVRRPDTTPNSTPVQGSHPTGHVSSDVTSPHAATNRSSSAWLRHTSRASSAYLRLTVPRHDHESRCGPSSLVAPSSVSVILTPRSESDPGTAAAHAVLDPSTNNASGARDRLRALFSVLRRSPPCFPCLPTSPVGPRPGCWT